MLSVLGDSQRELRAAVLAFKAADRGMRRTINQQTRDTMNPVWKSLVAGNTAGLANPQGRLLNAGVRIAAGNPPRAMAAQSTRAIGKSRRLKPAQHYYLAEFGVPNPDAVSTYQRRNRRAGGTHTVRRRTMRAWPRAVRDGRAVYPAFAEIAPRVVSLWVQTVVRTYYEAAEGRR